MLVRVGGRKLEYRPIAGTHRADAMRLRTRRSKKMLADEKERAEHLMLVDLGRNDVGRIARYGSVRVSELMVVERYSHVLHLVSQVDGELREGLTAMDAFRASFPAGTLTGAPKVRAMQIIEELEPTRRGVYGGGVLYADFAGNLDSCITIRTLLMKGKKPICSGSGNCRRPDPRASLRRRRINRKRCCERSRWLGQGCSDVCVGHSCPTTACSEVAFRAKAVARHVHLSDNSVRP
jgi:anthranilate/para-aminobenzoate synthase component I